CFRAKTPRAVSVGPRHFVVSSFSLSCLCDNARQRAHPQETHHKPLSPPAPPAHPHKPVQNARTHLHPPRTGRCVAPCSLLPSRPLLVLTLLCVRFLFPAQIFSFV